MTEKEKIAVGIMYKGYAANGKSSDKTYMSTFDLISKSDGRLSLPDLYALILHGHSQYLGFHGASDTMVKMNAAAIAYMESRPRRILEAAAFWAFGLASIAAAVFAALTYFYK